MKLKLDENLPLRTAQRLKDLGVDVDTAAAEGLSGARDRDILGAATAAGRLLVTLDRGFGDIRSYPPGSHGGVLVLRTEDQAAESLAQVLADLARTRPLDDLDGSVAVYRRGVLRVRRAAAEGWDRR